MTSSGRLAKLEQVEQIEAIRLRRYHQTFEVPKGEEVAFFQRLFSNRPAVDPIPGATLVE